MQTTTAKTQNPQQSHEFKPSAKNCADAECPHLETETCDYGSRIVKRKICGLVGKIPGRLPRCPLECDN